MTKEDKIGSLAVSDNLFAFSYSHTFARSLLTTVLVSRQHTTNVCH